MADIEYFYSAHSAFAYLGSRVLMRIAASGQHRIIHRPIDLRLVVKTNGPDEFKNRSKAHYDYYFGREIERWSQFREAPVIGRPSTHDHDPGLANCMLIAGLQQGLDIGELAHLMLEGHWRHDADLADRKVLTGFADKLGLDAQKLLEQAETQETRKIYDANTHEAIERSVFGSPTYFVNGDMFYGQDRLEMVELALKKPFTHQWTKA
jgi:2-hydroxychromene-2-carboxylate isomerase